MTFSKVSYMTVVNKYLVPAIYLMNPISYEFSAKVYFKHLEAKYWVIWTLFNKYFIPEPYLMDPKCDFFSKIHFKYLEAKYLTY